MDMITVWRWHEHMEDDSMVMATKASCMTGALSTNDIECASHPVELVATYQHELTWFCYDSNPSYIIPYNIFINASGLP